MTNKDYNELKRDLQIELLKAQKWIKDTQQKVVIIFEGRDAAGKGGAIKPRRLCKQRHKGDWRSRHFNGLSAKN